MADAALRRRHFVRWGKLPTRLAMPKVLKGKYPPIYRLGWGMLAVLMVLSLCIELFGWGEAKPNYTLSSQAIQLVGQPRDLYADSLKMNPEYTAYEYNKGYTPGGEVMGDSSRPKFSAVFATNPGEGATIIDPVSETSVTFKPQFGMAEPRQNQNQLIYPLLGRDAQKVYTLRAIGVKEDIILNSVQGDELEFKYDIGLEPGTEARMESDGSLSIYGVNSVLLGNVSTGNDADTDLLQKARENGKKDQLLFRFPAPFVVEQGGDKSKATAWFDLHGTVLSVKASGLRDAKYPLSIDPTVYVETAAKLMRGNNETNIDFDVETELIQKGSTTGARFDDWEATLALNESRWGQGAVTAGGYIYSVGGSRSNIVTTTYSTAGNDTYTVPSGVTSITVKMWGGGGGGGGGGQDSIGGIGGGAGFVQATLTVTPGQVLTTRVGGGGGGGPGRGDAGDGGGGGGHSEVENNSGTSLLIAAGGGGGGAGSGDVSNDPTPGGAGGPGGGATGATGGSSSSAPGGGGGGTGSGGAAGNGPNNDGTAGSAETGGLGADGRSTNGADGGANNGGTATGGDGGIGSATNDYAGAGGGGSGRFGGGGGAGSAGTGDAGGGGGGGGSNLTSGSAITSTQGSGISPGNQNDSQRSGAGEGGTAGPLTSAGGAGTAGRIIISYVAGASANEVRPEVYWAHLSTGGPNDREIESANPGAGTCTDWCTDSAYDLPDERSRLSLVTYNGFLYAIGGVDSAGTKQNTVYVAKLGANGEPAKWHPTSKDTGDWVYWHPTTTLSTARSFTAAVAYNNRMYLFGGLTGTSPTETAVSTMEYADINPTGTLGSWSTTGMTALPTARYGHTAHVYNDRLYLMGGSSTFAGAPVSTVHYIRLANDGTMIGSWQPTNGFSGGRMTWGGSFSTIWGAYIYLVGGCTTLDGNGYCTAINDTVQLVSINADGSLASWGSILDISNSIIGHSVVGWRNTLYKVGGCTAQDSAGDCTSTLSTVDMGRINQDGDASTVAESEVWDAGTPNPPCENPSPKNCDLPGTANIGNLLPSTAIMNGYLYVIGGCTNNTCSTVSGNVAYVSIGSDGLLTKPATCPGGAFQGGMWCVDTTRTISGGVLAAGTAVFNGRIYIVGGQNGAGLKGNVYHVAINSDGSLASTWTAQAFTGATGIAATSVSYTYAYARANPSAASTYPGNLFIFGGCDATGGGIGCTSGANATEVYKCWIETSGAIETTNDSTTFDCTTTGQLQIGTSTGASGPGLGLHAGTVYANYIYLIGGVSPGATDLRYVRYARFDNSNNVVGVTGFIASCNDTPSGSEWVESCQLLDVGRRRGTSFGYNGYLYVVGGFDAGGGGVLSDIQFAKIDVSNGSLDAEGFHESGVTINQRWGLSVPVSNSYAFVIGGCTDGNSPTCNSGGPTNMIQTFQMYNNESGAPALYSAGTQFTTDRMGASSAVLDGYIYIAGGCTPAGAGACTATDNVQYASIDSYGTIGTWSNTTDATLPAARAFGQLEAVGGTLYYIGGENGGTGSADIYYGTPSSGDVSAWNGSTNDLPAARTQLSAAVWNGRIYAAGGAGSGANCSGGVCNDVYASPDLSAGGDIGSAWTTTGMNRFNVPRSGLTAIAYANNLYVFGGYTGTTYLNDSQYTQINPDGTLDTWTYTTSLPTRLRQSDGFAVNGYMYLFGGRSDDNTCSSKTLIAPISANTFIDPDDLDDSNLPTGIGEWYETNVRYSGDRYAASAVYNDGKAYVLGGGCPSNPQVNGSPTTSMDNTEDTAQNVTMPATVDANDLLVALVATDGSTALGTTPTGWSIIGSSVVNASNQVRGTVYAKIADGTEDGATVNFPTTGNERGAGNVYRILAGDWYGGSTLTDAVAATGASTGSTTTPDPPSLNPSTWDVEETLWIAFVAGSTYTSISSAPTGFSSNTHINSTTTDTSGASASSARIESTAASVDPGTFTMGPSAQNGVAFTVAIRPALATLTGSNKVQQTALFTQPQVAKYSRMIDTDTDVFPTSWLMNGIDNSIGARWNMRYRTMHDLDGTSFQNPNEDCGTSASMAAMSTWGQETNFGEVSLGIVEDYIPLNSSGGNINCARYFYFSVSIDASQTFGYPEDVNRGPTINDLSLFFTSDPSKRLRHGKTFTGGEQQPLDTPCRVPIGGGEPEKVNCPLNEN